MRKLPIFSLLCLLGATLSGCAVPSAPTANQADVTASLTRLENEQQALIQRMDRFQDNMLLLEARVHDHQKVIDEMRQALAAQKVTPSGQKTATQGESTTTAAQGTPSLSPTEIYLKAFGDYASGRYPQAISGFETFLRTYPTNDYASNAQYWLGECYFAQKQYARAVEEFQKMATSYPKAAKTPDALFKKAEALQKMNLTEQAEQAHQELQRLYPDSAAARKPLPAQ